MITPSQPISRRRAHSRTRLGVHGTTLMDPRRAEELNRLGDEGWELVSITSINFKTGATDHIGMVFKREKRVS